MAVLILICAVFRSRAHSWRSFLLTINLSHARHDTYEVWGFRVTDGGVCGDWGECYGCLCLDGSGNNRPSIDDFYSAKINACRATSLPRMRKVICAEKEPGPPQEATPHVSIEPCVWQYLCLTCLEMLSHSTRASAGLFGAWQLTQTCDITVKGDYIDI